MGQLALLLQFDATDEELQTALAEACRDLCPGSAAQYMKRLIGLLDGAASLLAPRQER